MTCPLCQARFGKDEMSCHSGCPLHRSCRVVCCPHCHYSFVEESSTIGMVRQISGALRRLVRKGSQ